MSYLFHKRPVEVQMIPRSPSKVVTPLYPTYIPYGVTFATLLNAVHDRILKVSVGALLRNATTRALDFSRSVGS